jgi:hypothetical protein
VSAAAPFATANPRSLVVRLEVCRLRAELERLEVRLGELRSRPTAGSGRFSVVADRDAERAEELLDRMVAALLESGRAEIADATARRHAVAEAGLDADRVRADAITESARADLEAALAERGGALRTTWARGLDEVDLLEDTRPSAVVGAADAVAVPAVAVDAFAAVAMSIAPGPVAAEPASMAPALPRTAEVEEARTDAAFDAWMAVGPGHIVADGSDDLLLAPAPTDAAADREPIPSASPPRARSRWLLPLEVTAALLVAALLVVLGLVFIG